MIAEMQIFWDNESSASLVCQTIDFYTITVEATDMGGAPGGLKGTGEVTIKVLDINDNAPELEQDEVRDTHICIIL